MPGFSFFASDGFAPLAADLTAYVVGFNAVLFAYLAVRFGRARASVRSSSVRTLLTLRTGLVLIVAIGSLQRLAMHPRWAPPVLSEAVAGPGQVVLSVFAGTVLVTVAVTAHRLTTDLGRAEAFYRRLADGQLPARRPDLSARERDVVAAIRVGCVSDRELADRLHISASTAGTHVRNIMRKAGISDRRLIAALDID